MSMSPYTVEQKVKQYSFEALLKGMNIRKEAVTWPELRSIYDVDHLQKTYTPENFCQFWNLVQAKIYPDMLPEQVHFEMGQKITHGYMYGTTIGRLAFSMIHLMTPDNFFKIAPQLWDRGLGDYKLERMTGKKVMSHFNNCILPPLALAGSTLVIMQLTRAQNFTYTIERSDGGCSCYNADITFEWE